MKIEYLKYLGWFTLTHFGSSKEKYPTNEVLTYLFDNGIIDEPRATAHFTRKGKALKEKYDLLK
jgi:hypothetical protein